MRLPSLEQRSLVFLLPLPAVTWEYSLAVRSENSSSDSGSFLSIVSGTVEVGAKVIIGWFGRDVVSLATEKKNQDKL